MASTTSLPARIARFEVVDHLGSGGMADVFAVRDAVTGEELALKIARPGDLDAGDLERWRREARLLGRLDHRGFVRFGEVGRHDGREFYTMERLRGASWERLLELGPPDEEAMLSTLLAFARLLEAVSHLHSHRILHRDIKPSNVYLLDRDLAGENGATDLRKLRADPSPQVKLLDLGLAVRLEGEPRESQEPGTPLFMAPERADLSQPLSVRSDVYALGVTLYQLVTGELPFRSVADAMRRPRSQVTPPDELNPACSPELSRGILEQLSLEPSRRFPTAAAFREFVLSCLPSGAAETTWPATPTGLPRDRERSQIDRALEAAARGEPRLVLVAAVTGSGKTWLLERSGLAVDATLDFGYRTFRGAAATNGRPGGLRRVLLERLEDRSQDAAILDLASRRALAEAFELPPGDAATVGSAGEEREAASSDSTGSRPVDIATHLLRPVAGEPPHLLLLDDLHLASDLELAVLENLVTRPGPASLTVVATLDPAASRGREVLARFEEFARRPGATSSDAVNLLPLTPLADAAIEELLLSMCAGSPITPSGDVVDSIVLHAMGLPGRAIELLERTVRDDEARAHERGDAGDAAPRPWAFAEDEPLAAADDSRERLAVGLERLAIARARRLEARGEASAAYRQWRQAARWAVDNELLRLGEACLRQALEGCSGETDRADVLADLGELRARRGDSEQAFELLEEASEAASPPRRLAILERQAGVCHRLGDLERAESLYRRCEALAADRPADRSRLLYRRGSLCYEQGKLDAASKLFEQSVDGYRSRDDAEGVATANLGLGLLEKRRGDLEAATRHFREAITAFERAGLLPRVATALNNLATVQRVSGDPAAAIETLRRAREIRRSLGDRLGDAICLCNLSRDLWYRGEIANALEAAGEAQDIFESLGDSRGQLVGSSNRGAFLYYTGDLPAARLTLVKTLGLARRLRDSRAELNTTLSLAMVESASGDLEAAERQFDAGLALVETVSDPEFRCQFFAERCLFQLERGRREEATDALRQGEECAAAAGASESRGLLLQARAELALHDEDLESALAHALEADEIFTRSGQRPYQAQSRLQLGRIYRDLGPDQIDRAETRFEQARAAFEEMGMRLGRAATAREMALLWCDVEEFAEAVAELETAIELFRECGAAARARAVARERDELCPR